MPDTKKGGLYVYRAYDSDGFPVKEAYDKQKLKRDLLEEFHEKSRAYKIKRLFIDGLE